MSAKKSRMPVGCVILCIIAVLPVLYIGGMYARHLLHVHSMKHLCRKHAALMDEIAADFASLYAEYQPEVCVLSATYRGFEDSFSIDCEALQEDGSIARQREYPPFADRTFAENLAALRERYQQKNTGYALDSAAVYYDETGNMLIRLAVYRGETFRDNTGEPRVRQDLLIYMDEGYNGSAKWADFLSDEKPVAGRWFYWSENAYLG